MCVAPPIVVGAWSMAVLVWQPFEYHYYHSFVNITLLHWCNDYQKIFADRNTQYNVLALFLYVPLYHGYGIG